MKNFNNLTPEKNRRMKRRLQLFDLEEPEDDNIKDPVEIDPGAFLKLNLDQALVETVGLLGFASPTPIQQRAIPTILQGKEILATARTGSGKTAAYGLPMIQKLRQESPEDLARALILAPTRELALQIARNILEYCGTSQLRIVTVYGGVPQKEQVNQIRSGVDVIVATPGRLLDLIRQHVIRLDKVSIFTLDEADIMLDMGFIDDIHTIISLLRKGCQKLLFSATMEEEVGKLAEELFDAPTVLSVDEPDSSLETIESTVFFVEKQDKTNLLIHLLQTYPMDKVLVFVRTKRDADELVEQLRKNRIQVSIIHGDRHQYQRERALERFESGYSPVLVGTDIASRGIDIDDISHVINYHITPEPEVYLHRIGRTGRAGKTGVAYSFCNVKERKLLRRIEAMIGSPIPEAPSYRFKSRVPHREKQTNE